MAFVSSFCGASIACTPTRRALSTRRVVAPMRTTRTTRMSVVAPVVDQTIMRASDVLIAAREADFGGYTGPVIGLLIIGVIIAVLTPPVKE